MNHLDEVRGPSVPRALRVPSLRISREPAPPSLGLGTVVDGGTEWLDVTGHTAARTAVHESGASVQLTGVARYGLRDGDGVALAWPEPGRSDASVTEGYYRSAAPLLMNHRGAQYLHASAVVTSAGVVGLCATSGTGKSTSAAALDRLGYPLWADDAVVFAVGQDARLPMTVRLPSALRLDATASALVDAMPATTHAPTLPGEIRPLVALVVLERSERSEPVVEQLSSGAALSALLRHALCMTLGAPLGQRRLAEDYLSLVASAEVLRLTFLPDPERFGALVERLVAAIAR